MEMKNARWGLLSLLVVLFLTSGCGHPNATSGPADPVGVKSNFSWVRQNIFTASCSGCHGNQHSAAGLNLLDYDRMMSSGVVVAGQPESSPLYQLIQSGRMPMNAPRLPDDQIQAVHDWIALGAKGL